MKKVDTLAEAIYLCWFNSSHKITKQIDDVELRKQIRSYGFYKRTKAIRKGLPLSLRNELNFKNLEWVNKHTDTMAEDSLCECTEVNKQIIKEIETNLFNLKNKSERIAYANIILRNLDKSNIHGNRVDKSILNKIYKEIFEHILDHHFISEDNVTARYNYNYKVYPIYNLTVSLINHFDFIERLIESFKCFEIDLLQLADKAKCNLYTFRSYKKTPTNNQNIEYNLSPKFKSQLSDDCLVKIMHHLFIKNKIKNSNVDVWLYWFNRKMLLTPETLKWEGTPTMLSNIIQHLCGECISETIKTAFDTKIFVKPTKKGYEESKIYKELEQIITISKQKNN